MNGTRSACIAGFICAALAVGVGGPRPARAAAPHCAPTVRAPTRLRIRIDSLLALNGSGTALALAGPLSSSVRYLPHDDLLLLAPGGRPTWHAALPPYITPPGLAVGPGHSAVYAVLDNAVLLLNAATGRLEARRRLDMQALGWPAAAVLGVGGRLYIVGQPSRGWAAVIEAVDVRQMLPGFMAGNGRVGAHAMRALVLSTHSPMTGPSVMPARVVWRTQLGLFHAGIWLASARKGQLAVYLPGAYDASGTVALLDERSGTLHHGYAVPAPPVAADPARNGLYIEDAGSIRALALDTGKPIATVSGHAPLAVVPRLGLVVFMQGNGVTLATAGTLRPLAHVALPDVTALAAPQNGATILLGLRGGLARVDLASCSAL